jgi:hypothetical protein
LIKLAERARRVDGLDPDDRAGARLAGFGDLEIHGDQAIALPRLRVPSAGDHADAVDGLHGRVVIRSRAVGLDGPRTEVDLVFAQGGQVDAQLRQRRILPGHSSLPCAGRSHGRVDL